jgi:hypothetical protein
MVLETISRLFEKYGERCELHETDDVGGMSAPVLRRQIADVCLRLPTGPIAATSVRAGPGTPESQRLRIPKCVFGAWQSGNLAFLAEKRPS